MCKRLSVRVEATALAVALLTLASLSGVAHGSHTSVELVSVSPEGQAGAGTSGPAVVSGDGRVVAFDSIAENLVPGDDNNRVDVFVRDRVSRVTERISVSSQGAQGNDHSALGSLSLDGRYVTFVSWATNLVPGDMHNSAQLFVHDRVTHATSLVSVGLSGEPAYGSSIASSISQDGRFVAFTSGATDLVPGTTERLGRIFIRDLVTLETSLASVSSAGVPANGHSGDLQISSDGRFVAFESYASNLVPGDTNQEPDVFVRDLQAGTTVRASVGLLGEQFEGPSYHPSITADGRRVAFQSSAGGNVVNAISLGTQVFVRDLPSETTALVSRDRLGRPAGGLRPAISGDGRYVAYDAWGPSNLVPWALHESDVFIRDLATGRTSLISGTSEEEAGDISSTSPSVSFDGRFVVFSAHRTRDTAIIWRGLWTTAYMPGQIYLRDRGEPTCAQGWREEGFLTGHLHDVVEPLPGPLGPTAHDVSCEAAGFGA